jgi:hypothetical protein
MYFKAIPHAFLCRDTALLFLILIHNANVNRFVDDTVLHANYPTFLRNKLSISHRGSFL